MGSQLQVDNKLIEDLREDDPFRQEFVFFEREFAGVRPFECSVKMPADISEMDMLTVIGSLEDHLKSDYDVGALMGPATAMCMAHRGFMGDRESYFRIPEDKRTFRKLLQILTRSGQWSTVVSEDGRQARIFGKVEDLGSQHLARKNDDLQRWCASNLPEGSQCKVTGTAHLVDVNNASLASDMVGGLGLALLAVAILAGLLFRSGVMVVICLVTNVLPLTMIAAIMVLLGLDLKVTSGIIFTVAFGIAVDDTIHFLAKYRQELQANGWNIRQAVLAAVRETGVSMMYTSIVLFFGFLMFAMSEFDGTRSLGILVSVTLLVAMFTNLMLLPSLLMSFAQFVTTKTFSEPFIDLLDEEDDLAVEALQVQKGLSPGKGEEKHADLRGRS